MTENINLALRSFIFALVYDIYLMDHDFSPEAFLPSDGATWDVINRREESGPQII